MDSSYDNFSNDIMYMTEDEIDALNYEDGLFKLVERELSINFVKDEEDVKEMLKLKYHSEKSQFNTMTYEDIIYTNYSKIMDEIRKVIEKIRQYMESNEFKREFEENFNRQKDKTLLQLDELTKIVDMKSFPILTAGEAKAGKSTFINMLLGRDILPMNVETCTTAICEIRNSTKAQIVFHLKNQEIYTNNISTINFENNKEFINRIRLTMNDCEKVIFEYPVDFLNDFTYLVDSPGLGDNTLLESITYKYLDSTAPAFIFVLNSTNSEGLNIIAMELIARAKEQIQKQTELLKNSDEEDDLSYQISKAVFILNQWDVIKESANDKQEVENVRRKIIQSIQNLWHKSSNENDNIFFLSALQAKDWIKCGCVKQEVLRIRKCLIDLVGRLYKRNLDNALRLMRDILRRVESTVLNRINYLVDNKYSLLFNRNNIEELLKMLQGLVEKMPDHKNQIYKELVPKIEEMIRNLTLYIKSPEVEKRMLQIKKPDLIMHEDSVNILTFILKKYLLEELEVIIKEWNNERNEMGMLADYLEGLFENHLKSIGRGISIQNGIIDKDTLFNAWNSNRFRNYDNTDNPIISKIETLFIAGAITILFPVVALAGLLAAPMIINYMVNSSKKHAAKLKEFKNNPDEYFNSVIRNTLENLKEEDVKRCFFRTVMKKCEEKIESFEIFITNEITDKRQTIVKIDQETRNIPVVLKILNNLFKQIECLFGEYHQLRQKWCPDNSLNFDFHTFFSTYDKPVEKSVIYAAGRYSMLFSSKQQMVSNVVFKSYTYPFQKEHSRFQSQEIELFNRPFKYTLKCKSYTFNPLENTVYAVFEKNFDYNLCQYLNQYPDLIPISHDIRTDEWFVAMNFILDVSWQLANAMNYLHTQTIRMIHPDLRLSKVLIKQKQSFDKVDILIFDACTNLSFIDVTTTNKPRLKGAPEQVIDMGGYIKANIYDLGSIFYRLCYFKEEKIVHGKSDNNLAQLFDDAIRSVDSFEDEMQIDWADPQHKLIIDDFNQLIKICISPKPQQRPQLKTIIETLSSLKQNLSKHDKI